MKHQFIYIIVLGRRLVNGISFNKTIRIIVESFFTFISNEAKNQTIGIVSNLYQLHIHKKTNKIHSKQSAHVQLFLIFLIFD